MRLKFTKMHGLGNDFVVFDAIAQPVALAREQIRFIADRHFGVGCDQLLLVERARRPDTDFHYRIFNADGQEVEHCGNGARCFMRFVRDEGLTRSDEIRVGTLAGVIVLRLEADGQVTVEMGNPMFDPSEIPFVARERALTYSLEVDGKSLEISALSIGNPHAIQLVSDIEAAPVATQGLLIERHPRFPQGANAGYMQIVGRDRIRLRVYERGAGETLACGTGACAAVVAGITRGLLASRVTVSTRGGDLRIVWEGEGSAVLMTGPAVTVFEGEMEL
ncbi:MAG: diaminopimelate epimerase [Betaproteobacteria bacterium]|nr:diaminopimelate epimerase [Betaproteobacteria bacterium]